MSRLTRHLSFANVTASLALFLALGGVSWAAVALPRNSVGAKQIKTNAVSSAEVKDRALTRRDFASGTLLQGPQGPQGPQGLQGPKGDSGQDGAPGSARGFAHVLVTANGANVDVQRSENVGQANVNRIAKGVTCFRGLPFTPRSADVTVDANEGAAIPGVALAPDASVTNSCGGGAQALVGTGLEASGNVDHSYYIVFN